MHLCIPNSVHSLHSHQTSLTLHLKIIHFPSPSLPIHEAFSPYSAVGTITPSRTPLHIYPHSSIAQHTFQHSPRYIPRIHSVSQLPHLFHIFHYYRLRPKELESIQFWSHIHSIRSYISRAPHNITLYSY